jgi:hypothetical protein
LKRAGKKGSDMKHVRADTDSHTLAELAVVLRAIANERQGIGNVLRYMAMNYEVQTLMLRSRVSVAKRVDTFA